MLEDKIDLFLEELEKRGVEISGEAVFICNDGAVLFIPNEAGTVDIAVVRNPVKLDYTIGITDAEIELWRLAEDIVQELGGE